MPAIGRPDRQLNDVCTGLLYTGFRVRASCCAAIFACNALFPLNLFGGWRLAGYPDETLGAPALDETAEMPRTSGGFAGV